MAGFTNYFVNKILNCYFGGAAYAAPANLYLAAFTSVPDDLGAGSEVAVGGYARVALPNDTTRFPTTSAMEKNFGATVSFPEAVGTGWGTVVAIGIFDASTGGNLLAYATITAQAINIGSTLKVPAGTSGIRIQLD